MKSALISSMIHCQAVGEIWSNTSSTPLLGALDNATVCYCYCASFVTCVIVHKQSCDPNERRAEQNRASTRAVSESAHPFHSSYSAYFMLHTCCNVHHMFSACPHFPEQPVVLLLCSSSWHQYFFMKMESFWLCELFHPFFLSSTSAHKNSSFAKVPVQMVDLQGSVFCEWKQLWPV